MDDFKTRMNNHFAQYENMFDASKILEHGKWMAGYITCQFDLGMLSDSEYIELLRKNDRMRKKALNENL